MTSRREFFGFLAAAPIAVPLVAKEMGEVGNAGWIKPLRLSEKICGRIIEGPFLFDEGEIVKIFSIPRQRIWAEIDAHRDHDFNLKSTPNRLYGAQINADGDAV